MASPQAAGPSGIPQDANQWSTLLRLSYRPSVNNTKARTQHLLAAKELLHCANKCDIVELTKVERVAPEGVQETVAEKLPTVDPSLRKSLDMQFRKMGGGKGAKEHELYIPGAIILNELTRLWYKSCPNPPPFIIVHLANPNNPLPGDMYNTQCHPDFVSRRATIEQLEVYLKQLGLSADKILDIDDLRPAHGEVVSTVEIKQQKSHGTPQSLNYCSSMIRYRLNQTIAFGLLTAQDRWTLWHLDPSSVLYAGTTSTDCYPKCQAWYSWCNYETLLRYVIAIHSAEHIQDGTIEYVPGGGQMWNISVNKVHYRVHPFFASYPPGRLTRVGIAYPITLTGDGELPNPVYVKISYVDTNSQFREADLYEQAHSNGYIPGLARLVSHELCPFFVKGKHGLSQKEVVVLGSGGEPLNQCKSVGMLLKVIYDVIQTLEAMVEESVLHCDISQGNILCNRKHYYRDESKPVKQLPYIEAMLTKDTPVSGHLTDVAWSLVTDLGHSANMRGPPGQVGLECTGTPMYISGEIGGNTTLRSEPIMTSLVKNFKQIHKKFGQRFNNTFSIEFRKLVHSMKEDVLQEWNTLSMSGSDEEATVPEQQALQHEPRHDVESVFWVLVCCLVRALPDGANDSPTGRSDHIFNDMLYHKIASPEDNNRDSTLRWTQVEWKEALHLQLRMLAPMIDQMCQLLRINWHDRSTPSNHYLLHQGFKRLLFMQIREIGENDILLNTERPRTIYTHEPDEIQRTLVDSSLCASGYNSSQIFATHQHQQPKRGLGSMENPGETETTSTRKRPRFDHPAQITQLTFSAQLYTKLFKGSLSPPPELNVPQFTSSPQPLANLFTGTLAPPLELNAPDEKTGPFPPPPAFGIEPMEGPMQPGTEGTVDDDQETYEGRSQADVEQKAFESVAEVLRETIRQHRSNAESLVKMHLDDEAWHQVTVGSNDVFK